ncbi:DUF4097 family beta strand repeat-containing protein [Novisyntrophococcus fermenticellae]|uniref:DUF4097 family beta strand repeat-containing protein n=1 Tax=Novisyntrophococcus fermenticellae TaxID=2068655 RepID=UPI001E2934B2|nr:DUF4097 family beta strand repeat-containing protein [Novisyntrophococcus fermenticellae]
MKTWKKVLLIVSGIALAIGISCVIIGFALGFNPRDITTGRANRHMLYEWDWDDWDNWDGWWNNRGSDRNASDSREAAFTDIYNLDIDVKYSSVVLKVYEGSEIRVSAKRLNASKYTAKSADNTLYIMDETHHTAKGSEITILIPRDTHFDEVSMDVGGGEVKIDTLNSNEFSAEIGGGRLLVTESLNALEVDCSVGAGQIALSNLTCTELELDCGAGQVTAVIEGSQSDYRMEGDCGIGQIQFGTDHFSTMGKEFTAGTGSKLIHADCGVGQIDVQFKQQ